MEGSVKERVDVIKDEAVFGEKVGVDGLVIDGKRGKVDVMVKGYKN